MKLKSLFKPLAFFSFLGLFFPLSINSCSHISDAINEPVREYFERGSDVVQIVKYDILSSLDPATLAPKAKDRNKHTCVGSSGDIYVKLHVDNPQGHVFTEGSNLKYYLLDSDAASISGASGIQLVQNSTTEWILIYPYSFLSNADPGPNNTGTNISVCIELSHPVSGVDFPSFTLPLYCNSLPPEIANPVTYTKTVSPGTKTYVVCFALPDLSDMRYQDLQYINIGEIQIPITVSAGTITSTDTNLHAVNINDIPPTTGITYTPNGTPFPATVPGAPNCFYYETNEPVTGDKDYIISLVDKAGLMSVTTTAENAYTIDDVILVDSSGTEYTATPTPIILGQDEDSYAKVKIKVPTSVTCTSIGSSKAVSGVTVDYTVTNTTDNSTVDAGTITSDYNLSLAPGEYNIVCTATKDGYTQSETTFTVNVKITNLYVKSTGHDDTGNGTINNPYQTIHQADLTFPSSTPVAGAIRTIFVLDDLGAEQPAATTIMYTDCINCQNHTLTDIQMSIENGCVLKNATIAGSLAAKKIAGDSLRGKVLENVILAKSGTDTEVVSGKTTLKNVTSTNYNVINSADVTIKGKVVGLTFKLSNSTRKLTIDGNMAGSSNNKIELSPYETVSAGTPRVFTDGYTSSGNTADPSTYFTSDTYGVMKTAAGEAALAVSGGSISVYTPDGKLTLTATPNTLTTPGPTTIEISANGTTESGSTVTTADNPTSFTSWDIKAYYEYDYRHGVTPPTPVATPAAGSPLSLTFPASYPSGNYVIVIFVTFNGTRYSKEFVLTK